MKYEPKQKVVYIGEDRQSFWYNELKNGQIVTLKNSECVGCWVLKESAYKVLEDEIRPLTPLEQLL